VLYVRIVSVTVRNKDVRRKRRPVPRSQGDISVQKEVSFEILSYIIV
jgi:hypothetical protein